MSTYGLVKNIWATTLPNSVRRTVWRATPHPLRRLRVQFVAWLERGAEHDEIYDERYYRQLVEPTMDMSAEVMAMTIVREFGPSAVIDVGCGTGRLLEELERQGVAGLGIDHSQAAIEICRDRGIDVRSFDLESRESLPWKAEMVICTEVAEHLPASCADHLVDVLTEAAPTVLMTAAEPSEGGTDHVNEQPTSYWIEKFELRGFRFDESKSMQIRRAWRCANVAGCFSSTLMVFRRDIA